MYEFLDKLLEAGWIILSMSWGIYDVICAFECISWFRMVYVLMASMWFFTTYYRLHEWMK